MKGNKMNKKGKGIVVGAIAVVAVGIATYAIINRLPEGEGGREIAPGIQSINVEYAGFLDRNAYEWSLSDKFKVFLKLAAAYPYGGRVRFRYDGSLVSPEKTVNFDMQVSYELQIADRALRIANPQIVCFEMEDVGAESASEFKDAKDSVFALFKDKAKSADLPLDFTPTKVIRMTSAKIMVK